MANCFKLLRNGSAASFVDVDEEMCRHFGVPCDADRYFEGWYDFIGHDLAMGDSFDEIRSRYAKWEILVKIADWLEANFTVECWKEFGGRRYADLAFDEPANGRK